MTLYVLIGLSWLSVGLALLVLRLVREREPESQWRFLLVAAAAPFVLVPVASGCSFLIERVTALFPLFGDLGPLALLTGAGAAVALVRSLVVVRGHRGLLARCAPPEGVTAEVLQNHVGRLARIAGLEHAPRVLLYPRGSHVCALGGRRPTIVVSRGLLACLEDEEVEAVLGHEIAHLRQGDHLLNWCALLGRSVLFYLPPWSVGWRVWGEARERRADRLAVSYTGKPLALAAALIKVWRSAPGRLVPVTGTGFLERAGSLEARVRRLVETGPPARPAWRSSLSAGLLLASFLFVHTTVEGGTHVLARLSPEVAAWEECCDRTVSPFPHCVDRRRFFLASPTTADSSHRRPARWTS